jgi:hypothetical protein
MALLSRDVWTRVFLYIGRKDFLSLALVCCECAKAARLIKSRFADRYIVTNWSGLNIEHYISFSTLLHGPCVYHKSLLHRQHTVIKWFSLGQPVDPPEGAPSEYENTGILLKTWFNRYGNKNLPLNYTHKIVFSGALKRCLSEGGFI